VKEFRAGLRSLILGIRILEGQTYSVNECIALNLPLGSKYLKKVDIARAKILIIEGLAMLEGCCPVRKLVPALHCLCHYADGALMHGILRLYWMMSFGTSRPSHVTPRP
jgi:hypothetical protein